MENKVDEGDNIPINEIESSLIIDQIEMKEDLRPRSPSPEIIEQPTIIDTFSLPVRPGSTQVSVTTSVSSSMTSIKPSIRVEINERHNSMIQRERTAIRQNKQSISPTKTPVPDPINRKRYF